MGNKKTYKARLLPFPIIKAATSGDIEAINKVIKHYEGYIRTLSMRRVFDEQGNPLWVLDDELRLILETTLTAKILNFDVTRSL
jgi:hypothetical protein